MADQGQVVRLGSPAGEEDFLGMGIEQGGHAIPGVLERFAGAAAGLMGAGGIAVDLGRKWAHRLPYRWKQRRGGVVVEVNAVHRKQTTAALDRKSTRLDS